jgi:hypothetical protein
MKAEDLINKHLTLEGGSDLAITDGRIYNAFLNALNEAINYTRCCETFYCNNEHNFIERCSEMCNACKDLQD